jgi:hypothetical protein
MALRISYTERKNNVTLKSAEFFRFKYQAYQNDPNPLILFLYSIKGIHPNTGHNWNLIQALNFSYVPRKDRIKFIQDWKLIHSKTKNIKLTWQAVKSRYPYLELSIRRYLLSPAYYIRQIEAIKEEDIEKEVIKSLPKDYFERAKRALFAGMKKLAVGSRKNR